MEDIEDYSIRLRALREDFSVAMEDIEGYLIRLRASREEKKYISGLDRIFELEDLIFDSLEELHKINEETENKTLVKNTINRVYGFLNYIKKG